MIDKKELRVGNLVKYIGKKHWFHGSIIEVDEIGDDGINIEWMHEMSGWEYSYKEIEPIELNKEWLERLGFVATKKDIFEINRLRLWLGNGCLCYLIDEDNGDGHYLPNGIINHVHQVQNLYYWLHNEELTIKEPIHG